MKMQMCLLMLLLTTSDVGAAPSVIVGWVVSVHDGDTLTVRHGDKLLKVRLAGIDAPEMDQAFGEQSRDSLRRLALQRTVQVTVQTSDAYGRNVARVSVAGVDVETEQVRNGMAWVYRQYNRDPYLLTLEAEARAARRGLWADQNPRSPWSWRHRGTSSSARSTSSYATPSYTVPSYTAPPSPPPPSRTAPTTSSVAAAASSCGSKRTCKEMSSCEEARFYLKQCGLQHLDKDKDGTPCEAICR